MFHKKELPHLLIPPLVGEENSHHLLENGEAVIRAVERLRRGDGRHFHVDEAELGEVRGSVEDLAGREVEDGRGDKGGVDALEEGDEGDGGPRGIAEDARGLEEPNGLCAAVEHPISLRRDEERREGREEKGRTGDGFLVGGSELKPEVERNVVEAAVMEVEALQIEGVRRRKGRKEERKRRTVASSTFASTSFQPSVSIRCSASLIMLASLSPSKILTCEFDGSSALRRAATIPAPLAPSCSVSTLPVAAASTTPICLTRARPGIAVSDSIS